MAIIVHGITVTEREGSGSLDVLEDGSLRGVRIFNVVGALRIGFLYALAGYPHANNTIPKKTFAEPHLFDEVPGELMCVSAASRGVGKFDNSGPNEMLRYTSYDVTATYGFPSFPIGYGEQKDRWVEESADLSYEIHSTGAGTHKFGDPSPGIIEEDIGKFVGSMERNYVFHRVSAIELDTLLQSIGMINNDQFRDIATKETLLFLGASARQPRYGQPNPNELLLKFRHRHQSWQKNWKPSAGWVRVVPDKFETISFDDLFKAVTS